MKGQQVRENNSETPWALQDGGFICIHLKIYQHQELLRTQLGINHVCVILSRRHDTITQT